MTKVRITTAALLAALALPLAASAQAPAQQPPAKGQQPAPTAPAKAPAGDLPAPPPNYEYTGGGRRDPFLSLINRGIDTAVDQVDERIATSP